MCSLPGCKQIFNLSLTFKQLRNGNVTNKLKEKLITKEGEQQQDDEV